MRPLMFGGGVYSGAFIGAVILFGLQQLPALWSTLQLRFGQAGKVEDDRSFSAIQISVLAGIFLGYEAAVHVSRATITAYRPVVYFLGIGLIVAGSIISWLAIYQLGRYFTVVVAVRPDQPVIRSGLYGIVRHPSYAGQLLVFLGFAISLTNWLSIPIVMVCAVPGYVYRMGIEERAMAERLGDAYTAYARSTSRILPGIW